LFAKLLPTSVNGLLLIDKPAGMTSHDVVDWVRRRFRMRRVGHGGTLDPAATGLLILLLGQATRHARFLLNADKTYRSTLRLGENTDTQDGEGRLLERRTVPALTREEIERACGRFRGVIEQEIPAYSAVRVQGKRFYDLARAGKAVPRRMRRVTIRELSILAVSLPEVDLRVVCSSGTYVRTLCADLGAALGCGGHLSRLSRTQVGPFRLEDAVPLDEVGPAHVVSAERLIE
jgi:tRNA pseudouridine55 synthase